jgi:hypothetical protein
MRLWGKQDGALYCLIDPAKHFRDYILPDAYRVARLVFIDSIRASQPLTKLFRKNITGGK